jgi:prepilin-type N-terminal cleavage/methylation domain-containing protein
VSKAFPKLLRSRGFTLLEAIVALTILGIALVPVMSFMAESARQITVAADSNLRAEAQKTVMGFIEVLNPMTTPSAAINLSNHMSVEWVSTPMTNPETEANLSGRLGAYRIAFYNVDVTVLRDGVPWFDFVARKVGYESKSMSLMPGMIPEANK